MAQRHHQQRSDFLPVQTTLKSGQPIVVRFVTDDDRSLILDGFAHLSETSRYLRFLYTRQTLSGQELDLLTDWRDSDDVSIGAVTQDNTKPVGLARFIRLEPKGSEAEFALTVVDEFQGNGAGTFLFRTLAQVADRCGVTTLQALVHRQNQPMIQLLRRFGWSGTIGIEAEFSVSIAIADILNNRP